jgi:hemoglobin/transferrin/lactoferrin receptor protein
MKRILYAAAAMQLLQAGPVRSQSINADTAGKQIGLDEVTISVNRVQESRKLVAQQVQSLDSKQIAAAQAQTSADLLANTMGIFVQKSQMGGGSPVLRGFEANKVLLVIDGVRMNNLIYRGGHLQNVITVDNAMLDRVEVLYGPSSTIYGSDALGGVMHFYTKQPQFSKDSGKLKTTANAYVRYGSVNAEKTGHADFSIGGRKFASITSVTYSSFGDLMGGKSANPFYDTAYGVRPYYVGQIGGKDTLLANRDPYRQVQSGYDQYDIMQKFAYRQNEHTLHTLNLQYSNTTDIPRYDRLTDPGAGGNGLRFAQWYYGPQERAMLAYNVTSDNEHSFFQHQHVGVNYQEIEESRHTRAFGSARLSHRVEQVAVFGLNIDVQRTTGRHAIRLGLEQQSNMLTSTAEQENISTGAKVPLDTRYPGGSNAMDVWAGYASHTWRIKDNWTLNDGVRLGYTNLRSTFSDTSFFAFPFTEVKQGNFVYSGSAGIIHTPTDKWKLSLMVATGFRVPNVDDLAKVFESAPGSLIVPNNNLNAEKTVNTELGVTRVLGNKAVWENSVYYTRYFDAIVTAPFTYNGADSVMYEGKMSRVLANQNMGSAYIYGLWSHIRARVSDHLQLVGGLTYTYGRIATDSTALPLDHIPPMQLRAQAIYTVGKLGVDFFVNYHGAKKLADYYLNGEDNEQYATSDGMPAWMTANVRVSYKVHKNITVQAGVDNILDTQYRVFASGINAAGRNIFGVVRFNY